MAVNLARKIVCFAKSDTVIGTPETTFSAATNTLLLFNDYNPVQPDTKIVELTPVRASFTKSKQLVGRALHLFKPTTVLMGSGTPGTPPSFGPLLKACALNEASGFAAGSSYTAYTPISQGVNTATAWVYRHDILHKVGSALGTVVIDGRAGEGDMMTFDMRGLYSAVTPNSPQPTSITYPADKKTLIENEAFNIAGLGAGIMIVQTVRLDLGVVIVERPDYSSPKGLKGLLVTDRKPVIALTMECESNMATHDWWQDIQSAADVDMAWQHGNTPGNIVNVVVNDSQFTRGQYAENPAGLVTVGGDFMLQNAVDDQDFSITFK